VGAGAQITINLPSKDGDDNVRAQVTIDGQGQVIPEQEDT
jgi:hypothetical protein